jgi:hypothetical protein
MGALAALPSRDAKAQPPAGPTNLTVGGGPRRLLAQSDFTYLGSYVVTRSIYGELQYGQGFAHRYVDGQLRFMTLAFLGNPVPAPQEQYALIEFAAPSQLGGRVSAITGHWDHLWNANGWGRNGWWIGLSWDEPSQRLWTTSAIDYPDNTWAVATKAIFTHTLRPDGGVAELRGPWGIPGIQQRRVYGGVVRIPDSFRSPLAIGPYGVGFGGYSSRVGTGIPASMGPTLYAIPDPGSQPNDSDFAPGTVRTLMDHAAGTVGSDWYPAGQPTSYDRGIRNPDVQNDFEAPYWQSPAPDGLGRWTWGDSAWNTGAWIDTPAKHGFLIVPTFGSGRVWYAGSTLHRERYSYEIQIFDPEHFGQVATGARPPWNVKPVSRWQIGPLPDLTPTTTFSGNSPQKGVAGASWDPLAKRLYLYVIAADDWDSRIYAYGVSS